LNKYIRFIENGHIKLFNHTKEVIPKYFTKNLIDEINTSLKKLEENILAFTNIKIEIFERDNTPTVRIINIIFIQLQI